MQQRMQKNDMMTLEFSKEHFCVLDEHKGAHNHWVLQNFTNCLDLKHLQVLHCEDLADRPQQGEYNAGLQLHSPKKLRQQLQRYSQPPSQCAHLSRNAAA